MPKNKKEEITSGVESKQEQTKKTLCYEQGPFSFLTILLSYSLRVVNEY